MNKQQKLTKLKEQVTKLEQEIEKEKLENKEKPIYTKIPELGIEISQQIFNGKSYKKILNLVKEEQIATYEILQKCRNLDLNKYPQFKDFWAFVPNPDLISKKNNYIAWFFVNSDWANLSCVIRYPSGTNASLGVFVVRKIVRKLK